MYKTVTCVQDINVLDCKISLLLHKNIIVVGGGNSALEEAVSLTKYASSVTVVHQFDHFQAFESAIKEAKSNPKISFIMDYN